MITLFTHLLKADIKSKVVFYTVYIICLLPFTILQAQPTSWINEGFAAKPYPTLSNYFLSNDSNAWLEGELGGTVGWPNKWVYTIQNGTTPTYPTTNGGFISTGTTIANHAQYAGVGFLQYNNRSTNMPTNTNVAPANDSVYIATRALDFSGRLNWHANDTFSFWFYRDATITGSINTYYDSIAVYINTTPKLTGPDLVQLTDSLTGSTFIPRSSTLAPLQGGVGAGWRRCRYRIPNIPPYLGVNATSTAYIIIVAYSRGGGNMFLDDFTLPEWKTPMQIQQALIYYQEDADVDKNTTGNLILGVKISTRGSSSPIKLDAATFSTAGSTSYANDAQNPMCYYSGAVSNFATSGGVVNMPINLVGPSPGLLNFGWFTANCGVMTPPGGMQLSPGTENYIWLTYDIKSTATTNNYVGADFQYVTSKSAGICYYAATGTPALSNAGIVPQTLNKARRIDLAYNIPLYNAGLGVPGYADIDCVSAVELVGENGTKIENYLHDDTCVTCKTMYPPGNFRNPWCIRWSCHPNDYTNFKPENKGAYRNRFVQVLAGKGLRLGNTPYQLKIAHGDVFGRIGVFIDWNRDGDFDDTYYKSSGAPDSIKENYGTASFTGSANYAAFPAVWQSGNNIWDSINVPLPTDLVKDWNDPIQPPNNSTTPMLIANVRMRIREAVNNVVIHPFLGGYTEGETEDYTLQVLENCPAPGYNVCKWIGNTSDWNTISNWCPGIPTINDMAYIPTISSANFVYPKIQSNTAAQCRQLKLMDDGFGNGAKLFVDAPKNASLTVADDVIIGQNAPAGGTSAGIFVTSDFKKSITIPGASVTPGPGACCGVYLASIFRNSKNQKLQIAYTSAELSSTFGWQTGDIIDSMTIVFKQTPGTASTWNNFRIVKFETPLPMSWSNPMTAGVDTAVRSGFPFGTSVPVNVLNPSTITLNLPNSGVSFYTFNFVPGSFVWNGGNLVLSFEWWGNTWPGGDYTNYYESSSTYNVLGLKSNTDALAANCLSGNTSNGYAFTGYNKSQCVGVLSITSCVSATANYCATNLRPRLDFHVRRPYTNFNFTVGGNFINNNKAVRVSPYSVTPVFGVAGDSGFVAGYTKVIFNPSIRPTVTTPGYPGNPGLTATSTFNPTAQGATLVADIPQQITSATNASTVFNTLEINKVSPLANPVSQASNTVTLIGEYADTLRLINGEFNLNRKEFNLKAAPATSLVAGSGFIRSEDNSGGLAGNMQSLFKWKIGTNTGTHSVPFGVSASSIFNFKVNLTAGDLGTLSLATYRTPATNNTPYPLAPQQVLSMNTNPSPIVDATPWTVDRFWYVDRSTTTAIAGTMTFEYDNSTEGTLTSAYVAGEMKAQNYQLSGAIPGWHAPYAGQTDGSVSPSIKYVNHNAQYIDATYNIWVIAHINATQAPLPVELLNFDARKVDEKVRIWWDVQSEQNVSHYKIERTTDQSNFTFISTQQPYVNATGVVSYETYDEKPLRGLQYYRLSTVDVDGTEKYSDLKPVSFGGGFEILNIIPDALSSFIDVTFNYDSDLPYDYLLTDMYGKVISKGSNHAKQGINEISIPVQLARGLYFFSLSNGEKTISQKLIY